MLTRIETLEKVSQLYTRQKSEGVGLGGWPLDGCSVVLLSQLYPYKTKKNTVVT